MRFRIRRATTSRADVGFLREMLFEAATWRVDASSRPDADDVLSRPEIARYVERWGLRGDAGVIAENAAGRLGAAWFRTFSEAEGGFGFVDASVPELTLAVRRDARGCGIGTALLGALIENARHAGFEALSLSVQAENRALALYERAGFVRVKRSGNAWTMRLTLASGNAARRAAESDV